MNFSQRKGLKPVKSVMQIDSMDTDLRNGLWNALRFFYWEKMRDQSYLPNVKSIYFLFELLWHDFFKKPLDTLDNYWPNTYKAIREKFFNSAWYEVYDFIEFIANNALDKGNNKDFMTFCNATLERELSAYRFVDSKITQITSEQEISEIEEALKSSKLLKPVSHHLKRALDLLTDRKSPDYRNSIKESISAVEATCNLIAKNTKATLGQALKELENKMDLHPALKKAFDSLYGYTSDAEGIRHALLDESNLDFEDAKFMLVSCSAFVNYLKAKSSKTGIKV